MSAVTSRPRVRSVSSSTIAAAGGVAIVALIGRVLREMTTTPQPTAIAAAQVETGLLRSPQSVARELAALASAGRNKGVVATLDAAKAEALRPLADLTVAVSPADLKPCIVAVMAAHTTADAQRAALALRSAVVESHDALFRTALRDACATASKAAGFLNVHSVPAVLGGFRMVATDAQGRALVTEFRQAGDDSPELETELVGVTDGSCQGILDTFDIALAQAGVESSGTDRRWTGGVCESALAHELIKRRMAHTVPGVTPAPVRPAPRRTSRPTKSYAR